MLAVLQWVGVAWLSGSRVMHFTPPDPTRQSCRVSPDGVNCAGQGVSVAEWLACWTPAQ